MGDYKQQGKNLRKIRMKKKLTQEEMAKLLGYSLSGYRKIENGTRRMSIHKALEATKILECSLDEIFLP